MYKCNYCNRHLKKKYDNCPGCGAKEFTKLQNYKEEIIKTPPKGGYIVNLENYKLQKREHRGPFIVGLYLVFVFVGLLLMYLLMASSYISFKEFNLPTIIILAFAIIFVVVGIKSSDQFLSQSRKIRSENNTDIKKVEYLSKHGMLIKNLKYTIKPVNKKINGNKTIYFIQIIYEIEKGKTMCFRSEPKVLGALGRDDGTVDLLIDPNDYSNYFIDFEIY